MDKDNIRSRWETADARKCIDEIKKEILTDRRGRLELGSIFNYTDDNLLDLRGIPLLLDSVSRIKGIKLENVDLSYSSLGWVILQQCEFERVNLTEAELLKWNERGCRFIHVDFSRVKFHTGAIGIDGSIYEHVSFFRANLIGASFFRAQFIDCDFSFARLTYIDFGACNFIDCIFRGKLIRVWFNRYYRIPDEEKQYGKTEPNQMKNVDFSSAILSDVMFTGGVDLSTVIPPQDGLHIFVRNFDETLLKMREKVANLDWSDEEKRRAQSLIDIYYSGAENQPMRILYKKDFEHMLGDALGAKFIKILEDFNEPRELDT